jgi:50S ribosomal subunit-associated GTPase HflX
MERQHEDGEPLDERPSPTVVLTKLDLVEDDQLQSAIRAVEAAGFDTPLALSTHTGEGVEALQELIRKRLFGEPSQLIIQPPNKHQMDASERIIADVYDHGMVDQNEISDEGTVHMVVWLTRTSQAQLTARWKSRIDIK